MLLLQWTAPGAVARSGTLLECVSAVHACPHAATAGAARTVRACTPQQPWPAHSTQWWHISTGAHPFIQQARTGHPPGGWAPHSVGDSGGSICINAACTGHRAQGTPHLQGCNCVLLVQLTCG